MAQVWPSKRSDETVDRYWSPKLQLDDILTSATATSSDLTVVSYLNTPSSAIIRLSGGTAEVLGSVTVTVNTAGGDTLVETFLIGIHDADVSTPPTARDICYFAMRKIIGVGNDPTSSELDDALENLNTLLALWRGAGLDLGISADLTASTTVSCPGEFIPALKWSLRKIMHDFYGVPMTRTEMEMADTAERVLGKYVGLPGEVDLSRTMRAATLWPSLRAI